VLTCLRGTLLSRQDLSRCGQDGQRGHRDTSCKTAGCGLGTLLTPPGSIGSGPVQPDAAPARGAVPAGSPSWLAHRPRSQTQAVDARTWTACRAKPTQASPPQSVTSVYAELCSAPAAARDPDVLPNKTVHRPSMLSGCEAAWDPAVPRTPSHGAWVLHASVPPTAVAAVGR